MANLTRGVDGAQMYLGGAWIMLNRARPGRASPAQIGLVVTHC
jgi:hypothetical protein